jgi:hypothetical protein
VLASIRRGGHGARVVGGAVRNALLGRPVADIDIATTATPEQVVELAHANGLKTIATGLQHGTVTVVADGNPFEVTTLRHDLETYGRHAKVAFTDDWHADASRRDLTLNALYCEADGTIFDPLNGIRVAGASRPSSAMRGSIREDCLRILRFFHFTAEYKLDRPTRRTPRRWPAWDPTVVGTGAGGPSGCWRHRSGAIRAMAAHGLLTAIASRRASRLRAAGGDRAGIGNAPDAACVAALVAVADDVPAGASAVVGAGAWQPRRAPIKLRPEDGRGDAPRGAPARAGCLSPAGDARLGAQHCRRR